MIDQAAGPDASITKTNHIETDESECNLLLCEKSLRIKSIL